MIVSTTLMEHVRDNRAAVMAMFGSLSAGGTTCHYIPSGCHPYSLALRLIGPKMQRYLIPILRPGAESVTGYPAFFDYCTPGAMERLFRQAGFEAIEVAPYYRANDYFAFFVPVFLLVSLFENMCRLFNLRLFVSAVPITLWWRSSTAAAR